MVHKPQQKRCSCGFIAESGKPCPNCRQHERLYKLAIWKGKNGLRRQQLNAEPMCRECTKQGLWGVAAEVVDHIIPHRGNWHLFTDLNNLQSLCKRCHDRKSFTEQ